MDSLVVQLKKVRNRLLLFLWVRLSVRYLLGAAALACVWLLLTRAFPLLGPPLPVSAVILALALLAAAVHTFIRRPTLADAALEADRRMGLEERLTSSLALADRQDDMFGALHRDARNHLSNINVRAHFSLQPPHALRWLAVPLVIYGCGYVFLPEFDLFGFKERQVEAKREDDTRRFNAKKLEKAVDPLKEVLKRSNEEGSELEGVIQDLEQIANSLEMGEITEKQALARVMNLHDKILAEQEKLQSQIPTADKSMDSSQMGMAQDLAKALQEGKMDEAAAKAKAMAEELKDKIEQGALSKEEMNSIAEDMQKLSKMLGPESSLSESLAKAASALQQAAKSGANPNGQMDAAQMAQAMNALEAMDLSVEDLAEALDQMAKTDSALSQLDQLSNEWANGECKFCQGKGGECARCNGTGRAFGEGDSSRIGQGGLRGPGQGRGNQIGELPDVEADMNPTVLPGGMTRGKVLANILQRGMPDEDAESQYQSAGEAYIEVRQEAEQALTKEEIPPAARALVREYFNSLDPENTAAGEDSAE